MKKLLTLLGSVAIVGSSAAVAVACETRALSSLVRRNGETSAQKSGESPENGGEMLGDDPGAGGSVEEVKKKQIGELEEKISEAKRQLREANEKYKKL